jgi:small subunit ribosomal protein S19
MSKSKWKVSFLPLSVLKLKRRKKKIVWSRASVIPFFLVGSKVKIHSGKEFKNILITEDKVGYKFGEFAPTRKRRFQSEKKRLKYGSKGKSVSSKR